MTDELTEVGGDGIRRSFDEHYDTVRDVEENPTGAMWAIHKQAVRIEELEAALAGSAVMAEKLLTLALSIEAENKDISRRYADIAESIAVNMTHKQVELCKKAALAAIQYEEEYGHAG
jgi:hypothetical protein